MCIEWHVTSWQYTIIFIDIIFIVIIFIVIVFWSGLVISTIKIRRSWDRLIFIMEIRILVRRYLYTETAQVTISSLVPIFTDWLRVGKDGRVSHVWRHQRDVKMVQWATFYVLIWHSTVCSDLNKDTNLKKEIISCSMKCADSFSQHFIHSINVTAFEMINKKKRIYV